MKKTILTIAVSTFIIFVGLFCANKNPEFIWIKHPRELKKIHGKIDWIDINRIGNGKVGYKYRSFLRAEGYYHNFLPVSNQQHIIPIISNITRFEQSKLSDDTPFFLTFETGNKFIGRKIYCLKIGWNEETIYGEGWQSKWFYYLISDWKEDNERMMKRARQRVQIEMEQLYNDSNFRDRSNEEN